LLDVRATGGEEGGGEEVALGGEAIAMGLRDLLDDAVGAQES